MGNGQSVRATHFSPPPVPRPDPVTYDDPDEHHISISNKMVERLVEDATLAGDAVATACPPKPRGDFKDKIFMEKIKCLDDKHSERCGITVDDLSATARRIEMRTANMVAVEPVCAECKQRVIECYGEKDPHDAVKCWNTIGEFSQCVQDAAAARLRARTQKEARELARRSRHVAHAREHALKELVPPESQPS